MGRGSGGGGRSGGTPKTPKGWGPDHQGDDLMFRRSGARSREARIFRRNAGDPYTLVTRRGTIGAGARRFTKSTDLGSLASKGDAWIDKGKR